MFTKEDVAREYAIGDDGLIATRGRFQDERWQVAAAFMTTMDGFADIEAGDADFLGFIAACTVDGETVRYVQTPDGFIRELTEAGFDTYLADIEAAAELDDE